MHGGSPPKNRFLLAGWGLSPHARGKRTRTGLWHYEVGSIPACTGEAAPPCSAIRATRVYPRMHGGSSPDRVRRRSRTGLSPHARGKRLARLSAPIRYGSIPACTGEAGDDLFQLGLFPGLSPHARGKRAGQRANPPLVGSIPACTGEAWTKSFSARGWKVYPRMHGGSELVNSFAIFSTGLSPHARGKRCSSIRLRINSRSIPACTGEASMSGVRGGKQRVYPRMHGGSSSE